MLHPGRDARSVEPERIAATDELDAQAQREVALGGLVHERGQEEVGRDRGVSLIDDGAADGADSLDVGGRVVGIGMGDVDAHHAAGSASRAMLEWTCHSQPHAGQLAQVKDR